MFRSWIGPGNSLRVAVENDAILAVGCVTDGNDVANTATAYHLASVALMPSHTAPTKPVTITVIAALNV
jgi:hypothetical protein